VWNIVVVDTLLPLIISGGALLQARVGHDRDAQCQGLEILAVLNDQPNVAHSLVPLNWSHCRLEIEIKGGNDLSMFFE
jgi:hypothetical protein